jgi:lysozyme
MLEEMERYTGKRPIIYTDITFHKDVLEGELPDYPHWLRSTAAEPEQRFVNRKWMLWQFTSTGRVPGVQGDVDRNAFYGTPSDWASFLSTDCDPREHRRLSEQGLCTDK